MTDQCRKCDKIWGCACGACGAINACCCRKQTILCKECEAELERKNKEAEAKREKYTSTIYHV